MVEREMERMREREPVEQVADWEENIKQQRINDEIKAKLPHVVKYDSVPYIQNVQARTKPLTGRNVAGEPASWKVPYFSNMVREQVVTPGSKSGKHRHYNEAFFYIVEGIGYCVHDEKRYDWEAGDIFCVPTYCVHQRFAYPDSPPARLFYMVPSIYGNLNLGTAEPLEAHPEYRATEETLAVLGINQRLAEKVAARTREVPKFEGKVKNLYDNFRKQFVDEIEWRRNCLQVIKGSQQPWEDTAMGRLKWLLHPSIPSGLLCYLCYEQEIPPGGRSGKHRHVAEEVHKILKGRGYDIHDGVLWDWEAEDVVFIPTHTVHQHFNADPRNPARFVSVMSRAYSFIGHGGIEHLEDAPK